MTDTILFENILGICNNLENRFEDFFIKSCVEHDIPAGIYEYNTTPIIKELLFGIDENSSIKKMSIIKNRNVIKQLFLNTPSLKNSINVFQDIVKQLEEFINYISAEFEKYPTLVKNNSKYELNDVEYNKLKCMFFSYSWECTHIRSYCSDIKQLLDNSSCLATTKPESFQIEPNSITHCKKDTMKRYYFIDTYEIKNNIRYFDMSTMIFGETNTIMRMYNKITDFLFKDFMFMYNVIKTHFMVLGGKTTK